MDARKKNRKAGLAGSSFVGSERNALNQQELLDIKLNVKKIEYPEN